MFGSHLDKVDPQVSTLIKEELSRQELGLEMIASENYASFAVLEAQGSILTNKYAEGYPGKRYYGGCNFVDEIENLAISRAKKLFDAKFVNVQPHSGSQANMGAYLALLKPGDKLMGMDLSQGGHLTHGSNVNFSGRIFDAVVYGIDKKSEQLDYQAIAQLAAKEKPKMIIAGASAYPRIIDFAKFREIADSVKAYLLVDMAHIAGLVATGLHPNPLPYADIVTSTTHKTLRGPRGGIILTNNKELAEKINFHIFPGIQGGPLEHVIAAKAVAFAEALEQDFKDYQQQVVSNAKALAEALKQEGFAIVSGGTDNHMLLVNLGSNGISGKEAQNALECAGITCNKNMIPGDTRSPFVTSGIRLGTPAVTTRGLTEEDMRTLAKWIGKALAHHKNEEALSNIKKEVLSMCRLNPVYPQSGG